MNCVKYLCFQGVGANRVPKRKESNGKCGVKEQKDPYTAEDVRFTVNNGHLFAMILAIPEDRVVIKSLSTHLTLAGQVKDVQLLGSKARLQWEQNADGLSVKMPADLPSRYVPTFKINVDGRVGSHEYIYNEL